MKLEGTETNKTTVYGFDTVPYTISDEACGVVVNIDGVDYSLTLLETLVRKAQFVRQESYND